MQTESRAMARESAACRGLAASDEQRSVGDYFDAISWDDPEPDPTAMTAEEFLSEF